MFICKEESSTRGISGPAVEIKDDRSLKQVKDLWRRGAGLVKPSEEMSWERGERESKLGIREGVRSVENKVDNEVEVKVENKMGNKVENKVENKMKNKVEGKLRGRILVKPKEQTWMLQRVKVGHVLSRSICPTLFL